MSETQTNVTGNETQSFKPSLPKLLKKKTKKDEKIDSNRLSGDSGENKPIEPNFSGPATKAS